MESIVDSILKSSNFVGDKIVTYSEEIRLKNMIQKNFSFVSLDSFSLITYPFLFIYLLTHLNVCNYNQVGT